LILNTDFSEVPDLYVLEVEMLAVLWIKTAMILAHSRQCSHCNKNNVWTFWLWRRYGDFMLMAIVLGKKILPRVLKCCSDFGTDFLSGAFLWKGNKICVVTQALENTVYLIKKNLHGLSPRANYTDQATAACRRSDCQLVRIEGATWSAWRIPMAVFSVF
jgi:hypothetical protein